MGLDMYLNGRKFIWRDAKVPTEDGFEVKERVLRLGYWRKHPNLHGYIVKNFADGVDECQEIELSRDALASILAASENDLLPETTGFFFGTSHPEDKEDTRVILTQAIKWLDDGERDKESIRSVTYRASW